MRFRNEVFPNEEPPIIPLSPPEYSVATVDDGLIHAAPHFDPARLATDEAGDANSPARPMNQWAILGSPHLDKEGRVEN